MREGLAGLVLEVSSEIEMIGPSFARCRMKPCGLMMLHQCWMCRELSSKVALSRVGDHCDWRERNWYAL